MMMAAYEGTQASCRLSDRLIIMPCFSLPHASRLLSGLSGLLGCLLILNLKIFQSAFWRLAAVQDGGFPFVDSPSQDLDDSRSNVLIFAILTRELIPNRKRDTTFTAARIQMGPIGNICSSRGGAASTPFLGWVNANMGTV